MWKTPILCIYRNTHAYKYKAQTQTQSTKKQEYRIPSKLASGFLKTISCVPLRKLFNLCHIYFNIFKILQFMHDFELWIYTFFSIFLPIIVFFFQIIRFVNSLRDLRILDDVGNSSAPKIIIKFSRQNVQCSDSR